MITRISLYKKEIRLKNINIKTGIWNTGTGFI